MSREGPPAGAAELLESAGFPNQAVVALRLRQAGYLSLVLAGIALIGFVLVVGYLGQTAGADYRTVIASYTLTQQNLGTALLLVGLVMTAVVGVLTWLITLYSTFRVAGPLFRFARNLEQLIAAGPGGLIPIREEDALQEDWGLLRDNAEALAEHYRAMREAVQRARRVLDDSGPERAARLQAALAEIQRLDSSARL